MAFKQLTSKPVNTKIQPKLAHANAASIVAPVRNEATPVRSATPRGCACGGGCPRCRRAAANQVKPAKLNIGTPNDRYEREADRFAATVMQGAKPSPVASRTTPAIQRKAQDSTAAPASPNRTVTTGEPLPARTRAFFEPHLGQEIRDVRVHHSPTDADHAQAMHAQAYTTGSDIVFGRNAYAPDTAAGRHLLAHELAHVVQQRAGGVVPTVQRQPLVGGDPIHDPLIEKFRSAHGLPLSGVDPVTGQPVGPTAADLKYGGVLQQWIRGQPPARWVDPVPHRVDPLQVFAAQGQAAGQAVRAPAGQTRPEINGRVIQSNQDLQTELGQLTLEQMPPGGNNVTCRVRRDWEFTTSAHVQIPQDAPAGGWTRVLPIASLPPDIGQRCPGQAQIRVVMNDPDGNPQFVTRTLSDEQEHVRDVHDLHVRHLIPYAQTVLGVTGAGPTLGDCAQDLQAQILPHLQTAILGFIFGWAAAQVRLDHPSGTHSTTAAITVDPQCNQADIEVGASAQRQPNTLVGNVVLTPPVVRRFNPANLRINGNDLQDTGAGNTLKSFSSAANASLALRVIQHYNMDTLNIIGPLEFFLASGAAPSGAFAGPQEFGFDSSRIQVTRGVVGMVDDWTITEVEPTAGGINIDIIANFGQNRDQAYSALAQLQRHRFTTRSWIGGTRAAPEMGYFRV